MRLYDDTPLFYRGILPGNIKFFTFSPTAYFLISATIVVSKGFCFDLIFGLVKYVFVLHSAGNFRPCF